MAKKSMVERDKKRMRLAAQYAEKREALKAIAKVQGATEAREAAAELGSQPDPQPLRGVGSSARLLSQAQDEPYRAP